MSTTSFGRHLPGLVSGFAFLFLLFVSGVPAQTNTGQVTGNVTDEKGASVPSATVTITRVETGEKRTTSTSTDGNYTFTNLAVGTYRVSVTRDGFKETAANNVVVNVAAVTRQDFALTIGQVSEVVEITADSIQIETQSGTIGEIISGEQVRELPLNGRSFVQLTQLQPGVAAADSLDSKAKGLFGGVDFSVNGNSAQSNLFLTDGANNNDTGSNRTILLFPSIEAIAEFRSLRNAYGPEYGQAAGAVISIVTRGGTNDFHGSLFYFGRNDALNAAEYFSKSRGGVKDALRRHDYGFSLGGPIVKNRLFFFYSQEWNKELRGQARFGNVPSLLERQGNFSEPQRILADGRQCNDPRGGIPNGGVIPTGNLSPQGLALMKLYPEPNIAWSAASGTCDNWIASLSSPIDFRESNIRIDYQVTGKHKIFGRYTQDDWANPYPIQVGSLWGDDAFPTIESNWKQPSKQAAFKLTSQLTSNSINEVQFSYSGNRIIVDPGSGGDINSEINNQIQGFFPTSGKVNGVDRPHPVFWGGIGPYYSSSGADLWAQIPFRNALDIYSIRDDFSTVSGNHTMKMGFLYDQAAKDEDSGPNNEAVQFWGTAPWEYASTNNRLADILTRQHANGSETRLGFNETNTMAVGQNRYKNLEFYFGDTWKVRPNITLELGARYSIFYEPYDARDLISSFSPEHYDPSRPASDSCNGLVVPKGTNPCAGIAGASTPLEFENRSLRKNSFGNIAPRIGFAWDVFKNGKTAIRAGFGQFFLRERTSIYFAALTQNSPFAAAIAGTRTLDGDFFGLSAASNGRPQFGLTPEAKSPYALQYNFSVGQQLWKETVLELGYVGNRARNQLTHFDINQVNESSRVQAAFAADANAVNQFRPYRNYPSIYMFDRGGRADYHSLQVLFRTRFAKALSLQAAYTFSRSLADFGLSDSNGGRSDFSILDNNNRDLDLAESDINRPHIFVANMIYHFPSMKGQHPFVEALVGGWELAAIVQASSGVSITPRLGATGIAIARPDAPGDPNTTFTAIGLQGGVTGLGTGSANQRPIRVDGEPCTITDGGRNVFINPRAFTLVGYEIGSTNPKKSTCLGPSNRNLDLSIYKNFTPGWLKNTFFGEQARLQLRIEMYNAFNSPQFRGDAGALAWNFYGGAVVCGNNTVSAPCSATNNRVTGTVDVQNGNAVGNRLVSNNGFANNFGVSTRTRGGREIQYALKFYF